MRFDDEKNDFNNIMSTNRKISFNRFVELYQQSELNSNYLLMEYLSGNEYSADCAAWNGELFAIVIREKNSNLIFRWNENTIISTSCFSSRNIQSSKRNNKTL